jgi:uncharacterized double-CXXCG motif protein
MKVFQIKEDQFRNKVGHIEATHKWGLPGVSCPVCNQIWSTVGVEYPSIDFTNFADEKLYRRARCEPLSEYQRLRDNIVQAFPQLKVLKPGTEFGSLVGKAVGNRLNGFVWRAWWTISLEADALKKLKDSNLSLPKTIKAELKFKQEEQEVFEFHLPLKGILLNGEYDGTQLKCCEGCGRDSASKPNEILIDYSSLPHDVDIFRVSNFTTIILVTEKFIKAVSDLGIKGALFNEVRTK